jgi:hypothetical protein
VSHKKIVIKTSKYVLFKFLKKNFLKNKNVKILYNGKFKGILYFFLKDIIKIKKFFFLFYFILIQLICKAKFLKTDYKKKKIKKSILIDTTLIESCFEGDKFKDLFYGDFVRRFKKKIIFTEENLLFYKSFKYLKIINRFNLNFLYKFNTLNFMDYMFALNKVFFINIRDVKKNTYLENVNLNILIKNDMINSFCNFNYFYGLINYKFFSILKKKGFEFKKIINWNENQPADKGFVLGAKSFVPNVQLIGYSSSFVNFNFFFDRQPLPEEVKKNYIPNTMYLPSKKYFKDFNEYSKDLISLQEAPLFRFENLRKINVKSNTKLNNVLVLLPIELSEVKNLFNYAISIPKRYNVYVKFHPNFTKKDKILFDQKFPNLNFTDDTFNNLISKFDIIISNSSSTAIEAILYGKQVICPINHLMLVSTPVINLFTKKYYSIAYAPSCMPKILNNIKNFSKTELIYIKKFRNNLFNQCKNSYL